MCVFCEIQSYKNTVHMLMFWKCICFWFCQIIIIFILNIRLILCVDSNNNGKKPFKEITGCYKVIILKPSKDQKRYYSEVCYFGCWFCVFASCCRDYKYLVQIVYIIQTNENTKHIFIKKAFLSNKNKDQCILCWIIYYSRLEPRKYKMSLLCMFM